MKILSVRHSERQSGIPLPDLESVKSALEAFSSGYTKHSGATRSQLVADGGGMSAALLSLVQPSPGSFVGKLCERVEKAIDETGRYIQHFDYDGVGSFFKTTVDVEQLEDGTFLLKLSAAYVGNEVESGLAEHLGIQRGLSTAAVEVTLDARQGADFTVDFDLIAARLDGSLLETPGWWMARTIARGQKSKYSSAITSPGFVILMGDMVGYPANTDEIDRQIAVYLGFDIMTVGEFREQPYVANGSIVTGPLRGVFKEPGKFENPVIRITLGGSQDESGYWLPVLTSDVQARMRELAADTLRRFQP